MASAAARPAALADGLLLSAPLAARGRLGSGPSRACHGRPRARRSRGQPDRRHHRQPIGQDGRSKGGSKGYDAGKKINGRKRHILTDTDGRLLTVKVHSAGIQDMAYLGLVPSEHSSGGTRRLGRITKAGNGAARRMLIEAAWSSD